MQIDQFYAFVNEWNFDKIAFLIHLKIDIRNNKMLNIMPSQKSCVTSCAGHIVTFISIYLKIT